MNKFLFTLKQIIKAPILLLIKVVSKLQHYKMYEKWWVAQKLEHLFGRYEIGTTRYFKKHIRKGMVVVDVGANVGYFTRLFSKLVGPEGKVYAFEPDAEAFEFLSFNTAHLSNVQIFPYAVSDSEGEARFYHIPRATSSHTLIPTENAEESVVKTVSLDSLIPEHIDMIKIDIEGAEDKVFRGMKKHLENPLVAVFEYTVGEGETLTEELKNKGTILAISNTGDLEPFSEISYIGVGRGGGQYTNVAYKNTP